MTTWVCATPTAATYHDTEREALSKAQLVVGGTPGAKCVVYRIDLED